MKTTKTNCVSTKYITYSKLLFNTHDIFSTNIYEKHLKSIIKKKKKFYKTMYTNLCYLVKLKKLHFYPKTVQTFFIL